jgi:hypothetical protein
VQGIGRLVDLRLRSIAVLGQLILTVIGFCARITLDSARSSAALRAAVTSARVPALMFASCASAAILAANACSFFAIVSGLSMRTSIAPATTSWPSFRGISATRPSTRAAMSNRVASASPCTSRGCGRTKYQTDRPTTAAITTLTMMDETMADGDARSFDASCDCADLASVCMTRVHSSFFALAE